MEQDYEYLYAIWQAGSIKAAAEMMNVTQPAISIALKRQEDIYQTQLFDRRSRPLTATETGAIVLRYISQVKMLESLMLAELLDAVHESNGKIIIATSHYVTRILLPPILAAYSELYPQVDIELIDEGSLRANALFLDGKADVLISPIKIDSNRVSCEVIYQDKFLFCVPNRFLPQKDIVCYKGNTYGEHLSRHEPSDLDISILEDIPFVALVEGSSTYYHTERILGDAHITPNICQKVNQITSVCALANSGLGAALCPKILVWETMNSNKVTYFKYDSPWMKRPYFLMVHQNRYISKAVNGFLDICRQCVPKSHNNPQKI